MSMRDELKKRDGESNQEFGIRLYSNKMEYGLSNKEIYDTYTNETGDNRAESSVRGEFTNLIKGIEIGYEKALSDREGNNIIKELEEKKNEIEKEKIKVRTEKLELNKYKRIDVRNEMLYDEFKRSVKEIDVPDFKPLIINKGNKEGQLGISDFHFGKCFEILGNSYNEDIFYNRMNKLASETIEICRELGISKLHVLNCGDDIEGMSLRISQLKSLQYGFTDQVIKLAKYMVKFLNRLSEELEVVYHHVLEGNHSEIRSFGDRTWTCENMERIIITYITDMTENNPRITVPKYNGQYCSYSILGYNIYARHGHRKINENKVIGDVTLKLKKFIDYVYFGHLHHSKRKTVSLGDTNNKEVIYLPSIMGEDEYSQDFMFGGSKACAVLDVFEENKGIKCTYNIIVN